MLKVMFISQIKSDWVRLVFTNDAIQSLYNHYTEAAKIGLEDKSKLIDIIC